MNVHAARFGREVEKATARLVAVTQARECSPVEAYLALYGSLALVRNTMTELGREDIHADGEVMCG